MYRSSHRDRQEKIKTPPRLLRPDPGPPVGAGNLASEQQRHWEIVISGELQDKECGLHEKLVELPKNSSGLIYFDSCGGSAFVGLALATLIRMRGLKATAVVTGECSSAAKFAMW